MRLDDRSIHKPINMLLTPDVDGVAASTGAIDTADFDNGYTLIFSMGGTFGGTTEFTLTIETSDSSGSGFVAVTDSEIIGGSNPFSLEDTLPPIQGYIAFSRGVISQKRYVRVTISGVVNAINTALSIIFNGKLEVAPFSESEGTLVPV